MSYVVEHGARRSRARLRPGQLVVLESTTYPGTTDELVRGILEETGPDVRRRLLPRLLARARGPGQRELHDRRRFRRSSAASTESPGDLAQALYDQVDRRARSASRQRADGRGDEARREHLPRRQHRARQRAEDRLRQDGHRRLGGARRRLDEALRLHALQPRPGLGRSLHPARPVLPVLEGPRVRRRARVHRARRRGQRADAGLRGREARSSR